MNERGKYHYAWSTRNPQVHLRNGYDDRRRRTVYHYRRPEDVRCRDKYLFGNENVYFPLRNEYPYRWP